MQPSVHIEGLMSNDVGPVLIHSAKHPALIIIVSGVRETSHAEVFPQLPETVKTMMQCPKLAVRYCNFSGCSLQLPL